jgi:hypothetical protein
MSPENMPPVAYVVTEDAVVRGREIAAGSVGSAADYGDLFAELLERGLLAPFDPQKGIPGGNASGTPSDQPETRIRTL